MYTEAPGFRPGSHERRFRVHTEALGVCSGPRALDLLSYFLFSFNMRRYNTVTKLLTEARTKFRRGLMHSARHVIQCVLNRRLSS